MGRAQIAIRETIQTRWLGADPQVGAAVLIDRPRRLSVQFGRDPCGGSPDPFDPADAVRRPYPDSAGAAPGHRRDQIRRHPLALAEYGEGLVGNSCQTSAGGAYPETAFAVLENVAHDIVQKAAGCRERLETVVSEPDQAAAVCTQPQAPVPIPEDGKDGRIGQTLFAAVALNDSSRHAAETAQARSNPQVAIWRLRQRPDSIAEETVFPGERPDGAARYQLQAAIGAGPNAALGILQQTAHSGFALVRPQGHPHEPPSVVAVQAAALGSDPERAVATDQDATDLLGGKSVGGRKRPETAVLGIQQAAPAGSDPEAAIAIGAERQNMIALLECRGVLGK